MKVLQELEARLRALDESRQQLRKEQADHSRQASEIQKSLEQLDGQETLLRQLYDKFTNDTSLI